MKLSAFHLSPNRSVVSGSVMSFMVYAALLYGVCQIETRAGACAAPDSQISRCADEKNLLLLAGAGLLTTFLGIKTPDKDEQGESVFEGGTRILPATPSQIVELIQLMPEEEKKEIQSLIAKTSVKRDKAGRFISS
jgi:hypothetical protein